MFALRRVLAGELVAIFGGTVLTKDEVTRARRRSLRRCLQIDDGYFVYSNVEGPADWINHSCSPNCGMQGPTQLVAMVDIAEGEEVTFDYAMTDATAYDEFACGCGSAECRGRVTAADWQLPELWPRYDGYFSPYIARRIGALRVRLSEARERDALALETSDPVPTFAAPRVAEDGAPTEALGDEASR